MEKIGMNAFTLKIIALITMTIDHYGFFLAPDQHIFRIIGRISFVIFAYFIANGYIHTSNKLKHGFTLLGFGILIDIIMYFSNNYQVSNIFITLACGYFFIYGFEHKKYYINILILILAYFIEMDYSYYGIILIFCSYLFYKDITKLFIVNIALCFIFIATGLLADTQYFSFMGIALLFLYNGERGMKMKYLFYFYYPIHILIFNYLSLV